MTSKALDVWHRLRAENLAESYILGGKNDEQVTQLTGLSPAQVAMMRREMIRSGRLER